jgi:hypothetical protein
VNRDLHKAAATTLTFDQKTTVIEELSPQTGKLSPVELTDKTTRFEFPPGGIKLLKLAR